MAQTTSFKKKLIRNEFKAIKQGILLALLIGGLFLFSSPVLSQELFEYCHTSLGFEAVYQTSWKAQTFTPSIYHEPTSVKLYLYKGSGLNVGLITVGIRATDGANKPTGDDLCFGTYDGGLIGEISPSWHEINLSSGCNLQEGVKYAIVVRCPDSDEYALKWRDSYPSNVYADGEEAWSSNSGSSWTIKDYDFAFEVWGTKPFFFIFISEDLASTTSYIGDIFTAISPLFYLAIGMPLAFNVIRKVLAIFPM